MGNRKRQDPKRYRAQPAEQDEIDRLEAELAAMRLRLDGALETTERLNAACRDADAEIEKMRKAAPTTPLVQQFQAENAKLRDGLDKARRQISKSQEAHTASLAEWNAKRAAMVKEIERLNSELAKRQITLRDHFAAAALSGMLSVHSITGSAVINIDGDLIAAGAWKLARFMLANRAKKPT